MKGLVLAALAVLTLSIATAAAFAENNGGGNAHAVTSVLTTSTDTIRPCR